MEPLSALSLAGNVLQFIEFTTKILSSSVEVYKSSTGASDSTIALEDIYRRLSSFSDGFVAAQGSTRLSPNEIALRDIADSCIADCARLLEVLKGVKVDEGGHRAWKSFRAALKLAWKGEQEIERLESRLRSRQSMMTLQICAISNEWLRNMNEYLREHEKQSTALQFQQLGKLEEMSSDLQEVKLQVSGPRMSTFSSTELNELTNKVSHLSLIKRDIIREQVFLSSLDYSSRRARYVSITKAHARTFSWIFEASNQEATNDNGFVRWLRESGGVFWITGKPGSGKSTLMKYLADHTRTIEVAEQWAAPDKVIVASHFFWLQGISMQKSMEGLFQSLLYDVFRQCPELMAEACPSRWENSLPHLTKQDWEFKELIDCFQCIGVNSKSAVKFCFFIDGLDEFDGDYMEICQTLSEIAKYPRMKLCVASRPLNEFQDRFGADKSSVLQVHELTRKDIMNYARSRLEEHPRWSIPGLDAPAAQLFLAKIADTARGVFLWVTLVTDSLRRGLTSGDTIEDLNARLDILPKTLEGFYKYMLDSVDPVYYCKSASLLQMLLFVQDLKEDDPFPVKLHWVVALLHEREYSDPDYAITMPQTTVTPTDIQSLRDQASRRLNAKCCCILEICGNRLEFIHRTASDYLKTPEMVDYIRERNRKGFSAHLSTLKAWVACLKMGVLESESHELFLENALADITDRTFSRALQIAERTRISGVGDDEVFKLIDCLESIPALYPNNEFHTNKWKTPVGELNGVSAFKRSLFKMYAFDYAAMKLSNNVRYFQGTTPPVIWALTCGLWIASNRIQEQLEFLHLLLQNGYDPNEIRYAPDCNHITWIKIGMNPWRDDSSEPKIRQRNCTQHLIPSSCWSDYLMLCGICGHFGPRRRVESVLHRHCMLYSRNDRPDKDILILGVALDNGIYSLLLRHGADPNAHPTPFTTAWADFVRFGIKCPSRFTASESYLTTLDDFFKHGADLGALTVGLTLRPGDASSHLPLRMITGWSTFCEALEDLTGSETEKEIEFISQITMKMIKQAMRTQWPVGRLPSIIKRVFPEVLYQPMIAIFSEGQVRGADLKTRDKRPSEEEAEGESKWLKTYSTDMAIS